MMPPKSFTDAWKYGYAQIIKLLFSLEHTRSF